jgi:hypothetical protein
MRMLDRNPMNRATIDELIEMDWVTNSGIEPLKLEAPEKKTTLQIIR